MDQFRKNIETKSAMNICLPSRRTQLGLGIIPQASGSTMKILKPMGQPKNGQFYIRRVLPAEQTAAIAKSMLKRQAKRKDFSIPTTKEVTIIGRNRRKLTFV
jgi:hypothetical protein